MMWMIEIADKCLASLELNVAVFHFDDLNRSNDYYDDDYDGDCL